MQQQQQKHLEQQRPPSGAGGRTKCTADGSRRPSAEPKGLTDDVVRRDELGLMGMNMGLQGTSLAILPRPTVRRAPRTAAVSIKRGENGSSYAQMLIGTSKVFLIFF